MDLGSVITKLEPV